jgi:hypothetical protein
MDSGTRPVNGDGNASERPTSDDLLRQVRLTRTRLDAKADALNARLQPRVLLGDVQDGAFRSLVRTKYSLRHDPKRILVPAAVVVAGVAGWLTWRARKKRREALYLTAGATIVAPPPPRPKLISTLTTVASLARQVERAAKAVNTLRANGGPKAYPTAY